MCVCANYSACMHANVTRKIASFSDFSVHPTLPLLATSSGQRTFNLPFSGSESDSDDDEPHPDNSIKLWSLLGKDVGAYADLSRSLALNE